MLKKIWFMFVLWSVLMVSGCSGGMQKNNTESVAVTDDVVAVYNSATSVGTEQTETSEIEEQSRDSSNVEASNTEEPTVDTTTTETDTEPSTTEAPSEPETVTTQPATPPMEQQPTTPEQTPPATSTEVPAMEDETPATDDRGNPADMELSAVGKYGLLWLTYIKENHKGRFRTLTRLGCVNRTAHKVNEEAYEMIDLIIGQHMRKHPLVNHGSTIEMWKLREQAKSVAEEIVLMDIVKVNLAVGVPLTLYGKEKKEFKKYLRANDKVSFYYEGVRYVVHFGKVRVFAQCHAAIAKNKESIMDTINAGLKRYALEVEAKLRELKIDFDFTNVVYVGGGAGVMRRFGSCTGENVRYVTDVRANALGYQYLAQNLEV